MKRNRNGMLRKLEDSNKVPRFTSEKESQKRKINMGVKYEPNKN